MTGGRLGLLTEVGAHVAAVEHVDALEPHDYPGDGWPVDGHGRADPDSLAEFAGDKGGGAFRLEPGVVDLLGLADRPVEEHATFATITGTLTWKQVDKDQGQQPWYTFENTQNRTFNIDATLTHTADGSWTSHSVNSTYTYSDDSVRTVTSGTCVAKTTVGGNSGGALVDGSSPSVGTLTVEGSPLPSQ